MAYNPGNYLKYSKSPILDVPLIQQETLKVARNFLGLSQLDMAKTLDISLCRWSRFELGKVTTPRFILMAVTFLLVTSESSGLETVAELASQKLLSQFVDRDEK
jgi:transcriptional regulator with XRE-family HTH domain